MCEFCRQQDSKNTVGEMTNYDLESISRNAKAIHPNYGSVKDFNGFKTKLNDWIHSSTQVVAGLPGQGYVVSGVTDALNQTYALYHKIGIFRGEYSYTRTIIGDRATFDLEQCDAIVLSHPFSADGKSSHDKLAIANTYNKPIFVDCAFFGVCGNIDFDFSAYQNIHSVCFSLSKTFGTGNWRTGMLYTNDEYPSKVYEPWAYHFLAGAEYHYQLLDKWSPDYMYETYRDKQLTVCSDLGFLPSDTVIFGLDFSDKWKYFDRGGTNRMCISDLLV